MPRILIASALLTLTTACGSDHVWLESGSYDLQDVWAPSGFDGTLSGQLVLDVDLAQVAITDADGAETTAGLDFRPRREWASGCPGNVSNSIMEVAVLGVDDVVLAVNDTDDPITVPAPILVAECGTAQGTELVLREDPADGDLTSGGSACGGADVCLVYALP